MNSEPAKPYGVAEFLYELREFVAGTGLTQKTISTRAAEVPRSTLSDLLGTDRRSLPRPELLADVLRACGLPSAKINDWESKRRRAAHNSREENTDSNDEVERLQQALAVAVGRVDELKAEETHLRSRLHHVDQEKQELARALEAARADSRQSATELTAQLAAAEEKADRLSILVEEVAKQVLQAELDAAHLRTRLTMTELELVHERIRRDQRQRPTGGNGPYSPRDGAGPAGGVSTLKKGLHQQIARNENAATLVSGAVAVLEEIETDLNELLDGASGDILDQLHAHMETALTDLKDALRGSAEFEERARRQFALATEQIGVTSENVRQCAEHIAEAQACLERSQEGVAFLLGADSNSDTLAPVAGFIMTSLRECQAAVAEIETAVRDYAERL